MSEIADLEPRLGRVSVSTVGDIRQVLEDLGKEPIPEWAGLSDDDFLAICGYPLGEPDTAGAPTTTCADGEIRGAAAPAQASYFVAENGLGVRDITQDDLAPFEAIGCP